MAHRQSLRFPAAALLFWAALSVPAAEPDPAEVLKLFSAHVARNGARIKDYTCVESVERVYYRPAASTLDQACSALLAVREHPTPDMVLRMQGIDRLRLDVADTATGEIYSWVGASRFDSTVDLVVREGPIGTGAFGSLLTVIFGVDAKSVNYRGTMVVNGRRLMEYTFEVPQTASHYLVKVEDGSNWIPSAYSGSVLVDPRSGDPVHLTIRTAELPEATGTCQSISNLDYQRVEIGDRELLLPEKTEQRFISRNGRETVNGTTFSSCREYSSESTVKFDQEPDATSDASAKPAAPLPSTLPAGLRLVVELTTPIDTATAAVGDRFVGKLMEPVRAGRQVLAPKGAVVHGRITTMRIAYLPAPNGLLGFTPRTIEVKGSNIPLTALPDAHIVVAPGKKTRRGLEIFLPPPGDYSELFHFTGARHVFRPGFVSEWVTVSPPRSR